MKKFSGFGNSPAKLIKKPTGPRATKKSIKDDRLTIGKAFMGGDIKLDPGFEDIKKIQRVQREGLTPYSQNFSKKAKKLKKKPINFENPKDRDKIYNKTEIKRR